jgi:hypothetical protein
MATTKRQRPSSKPILSIKVELRLSARFIALLGTLLGWLVRHH